MAKVSVTSLLAAGGGGLLVYSGITGKNFSSAIRAFLAGKSPATATKANPILGTPAAAFTATGTTQAPGTTTIAGRG